MQGGELLKLCSLTKIPNIFWKTSSLFPPLKAAPSFLQKPLIETGSADVFTFLPGLLYFSAADCFPLKTKQDQKFFALRKNPFDPLLKFFGKKVGGPEGE